MIAGEGCAGNMGYFKVIIAMAVAGCATCVGFLMVSAQHAETNHYYPHRKVHEGHSAN